MVTNAATVCTCELWGLRDCQSYCVLSAILERIFPKEKLELKQCVMAVLCFQVFFCLKSFRIVDLIAGSRVSGLLRFFLSKFRNLQKCNIRFLRIMVSIEILYRSYLCYILIFIPPMKLQFKLFRCCSKIREPRSYWKLKWMTTRLSQYMTMTSYVAERWCLASKSLHYCFFKNSDYCLENYRPHLQVAIVSVYPEVTLFDVESRHFYLQE